MHHRLQGLGPHGVEIDLRIQYFFYLANYRAVTTQRYWEQFSS